MVKGSAGMANKNCSSSAPPVSWKNLLKEFEELTSNEITSLWDSKVNFNALVETNLVFEADREKVRKMGLQEACEALITKGLEIVVISKMIDLESNGFDDISNAKQLEEKDKEITKLKATMKLFSNSNKTTEKKAADLASKLEKRKKEFEDSLKAKDEEIANLNAEAVQMKNSLENLQAENSKLSAESSSLKIFVLDHLEVGFAKAKEQISFLNPELAINFKGSDPYARIVDGKLVSPDNADEEEEEAEEGEDEE